jgi:hypothetical protein
LIIIPYLGGDKDIDSGYTALTHTCANIGLIAVNGSRVNVAITSFESVQHRFTRGITAF